MFQLKLTNRKKRKYLFFSSPDLRGHGDVFPPPRVRRRLWSWSSSSSSADFNILIFFSETTEDNWHQTWQKCSLDFSLKWLCFCLLIGSTQNKQEVQTGQKSVVSLESSSLKLLSQLVPNLVRMFIEGSSKIIMFLMTGSTQKK